MLVVHCVRCAGMAALRGFEQVYVSVGSERLVPQGCETIRWVVGYVEAVLAQVALDDPYQARLIIDDQRAQLPRRTHDQASSFAMNVPCQVWYQTAPVVAFTDSIPTVFPAETVSIV